jgi:hypothetical protein
MDDKNNTPDQFWRTFSGEFNKWWNEDNAKKKGAYELNKKWTSKILCFLEELGETLGYFPDREWLARIDVCYFSNFGKDWSEWSCEVAIEHENDGLESAKNECSKLMSINAALKVLITYYNESDDFENYIDDFKRIYTSRRYHQEHDKYLFIFFPNSSILEKGKGCNVYKFEGNQRQLIIKDIDIFRNSHE